MNTVPVVRGGPVVATIALGTVLNPLDATMVAVALNRIQGHFGVSVAAVSLLASGFFVAGAVGQALMGGLADRFGPRRVFRAGLLVVAVACTLAPLAPTLGSLVGLRVVQALGTSVAFPTGMAIIRRRLSRSSAKAMGGVTTVNTLSAAVGPLAGGLLVSWAGWQATFLANVPVAVAAVVLAGRVLPADPPRAAHPPRVDLPGAALYTAALVALLTFLLGPGSPVSWAALAVAVPFAVGFLRWERRVREPFLDVTLLARRPVLLGVFAQYGLANIAYYGMLYVVPTWLQAERGTDPTTAGLVLVPVAVCSAAVTPLAAWWIQSRGARPTLLTASAVLVAGGGLLLTVDGTTPLASIAVACVLIGMVNNPNTLGLQALLYAHTPTEQTGTVSGFFQGFRYIGSILSTALLGLAVGPRAHDAGIHLMAGAVLAVGVLVTAVNVLRPR
ncbi:MFS transporter [Streptomyces catenulae]|uniref:MFS transporter n=1 Tax=Streptomyces catenulae TaxID=66875 RepID=A0ABV2YS58_9ACTN|nr:MFS transporter [Streptomyces catenulae]